MAIRSAPRRQLRLDALLTDQGGVRSYVLARVDRGDHVADIARALSLACGERISSSSLYVWIRDWRNDGASVAGRGEKVA